MEADSGRVLFAQNPDTVLPNASTTKMMTALIALEQPDLDEPFTVDGEAIRVEGTTMGLQPGDTVTLRQPGRRNAAALGQRTPPRPRRCASSAARRPLSGR